MKAMKKDLRSLILSAPTRVIAEVVTSILTAHPRLFLPKEPRSYMLAVKNVTVHFNQMEIVKIKPSLFIRIIKRVFK